LSTVGFVVAFYNDNVGPDGTSDNVYLREYDAAGNPVDGDRIVNSYTTSTQYLPALADLGNGNYAAVWASYAQDGSTYGIFQQLFGDTAELPRQANPQLVDFIGTVTFAENTVNAGLQVIDAAVGLSDPDSGNFNGGRLDLYFIQNGAAEDQLGVVHQGNAAGQIGVSGNTVSYGGVAIGTISGGSNGANLRIDFTSTAATVDAVEALIQRLGYSNTDSSPNPSRTLGLRVSDGDGGSSTPNVLTINVTQELDGTPAAYGESQINTYTAGAQDTPAMAVLADGSYVVAWASAARTSPAPTAFMPSASPPAVWPSVPNSASTRPPRARKTTPRWRPCPAAASSWCGPAPTPQAMASMPSATMRAAARWAAKPWSTLSLPMPNTSPLWRPIPAAMWSPGVRMAIWAAAATTFTPSATTMPELRKAWKPA